MQRTTTSRQAAECFGTRGEEQAQGPGKAQHPLSDWYVALSHGFDVTLLGDCHTTGDSVLPAQQIVDHHNFILPRLAHPQHAIDVVASTNIRV